jgi:hypothetical protein
LPAGRRKEESNAITAYKEFPKRSHYTIGQPGLEEVADYALNWALRPTANTGGSDVLPNHDRLPTFPNGKDGTGPQTA